MAARLALLGDIHANLPAFAAVLEAMDALGIRDAICTGDLVMRGNDPEECIELLRRRGWPSVAGNTDVRVVNEPPRPKDHPASVREGSRSWSIRHLSVRALTYLAALPEQVRLTLDGHRIVAVHGHEQNGFAPVDENSPDKLLLALAASLDADCLVTGHTHRAFVRRIGPLLVVNPGGVGESAGDDLRPSWGWIAAGPDGLEAHLERVGEPLARVRDRASTPG